VQQQLPSLPTLPVLTKPLSDAAKPRGGAV